MYQIVMNMPNLEYGTLVISEGKFINNIHTMNIVNNFPVAKVTIFIQ